MTKTTFTVIYRTLVIVTLAVILVIALVGSGIVSNDPVTMSSDQSDATEVQAGEAPVPVEVTAVQQRPLTRTLDIPATLEAYEQADLYAKISGYVARVNVDIGSTVQPGDVLMEIAVPELEDELRQLEAVVEAKRAREDLETLTMKRKEQLAAEKAISQQALDEARGQWSIAKADTQVAEAKATRLRTLLDYATLTAPFAGRITARYIDPGAFVRSAADGQSPALFTLARTGKIRLVIQIPETDVPHVGTGTDVTVALPSLNDTIQANVTRTAAALNAATRTMRAEVDIENQDGQWVPGMYAQVSVVLQTKAQAKLIPAKAIRVQEGQTSVLVAREGLAEACPVDIGYDDGHWAEIIGGQLQDGDWVITSAGSIVAPGVRVKPVQDTDATAISAVFSENKENGDNDEQQM